MSQDPVSAWYADFFTELPNAFWRAAVPPSVTATEVDFIVRISGPGPRARVLDVPCGSGRHTCWMARSSIAVVLMPTSATRPLAPAQIQSVAGARAGSSTSSFSASHAVPPGFCLPAVHHGHHHRSHALTAPPDAISAHGAIHTTTLRSAVTDP